MKVVLISTYELGHQPFGLASPAAWLRRDGHEVACIDTSQQALKDYENAIVEADAVAFYLPMHTATRISLQAIERVQTLNAGARLCAYGLYAPMNAEMLAGLGVERIIGGEFERELVEWVAPATSPTVVDSDSPSAARTSRPHRQPPGWRRYDGTSSLERLSFITPDRSLLPPLKKYAKLRLSNGEERVAGYTEATRGCKHLCRHCPIVPVYNGAFRVVQRDVVLADIRQQVAAGAQHITFGDPDFLNGPTHAIEIVQAFHREFPDVSYDATIKVEHLLKHADLLPVLRDTNCAFVVTAVESFDNEVLARLEKGHTREDFVEVVRLFRETGLNLSPTFIAFTPWTTLESYNDFLHMLASLDLVENVPSIQLAIRLLVPSGSRVLELPELRNIVGRFDREMLCYRWWNPDPFVDQLQRELEHAIQDAAKVGLSRSQVFGHASRLVSSKLGIPLRDFDPLPARATIPYLTEPWYC